MDRDSVRIILAVVGVIVLAATYIWGRYRQRILDFVERREEFDEYDRLAEDRDTYVEVDAYAAGHAQAAEHKKATRIPPVLREPVASPQPAPAAAVVAPVTESAPPVTAPRDNSPAESAGAALHLGAPFLIQLSLIAETEDFFRGELLYDAFQDEGLVHGEMGIYHRYDADFREPLFSVASLIEPGTFPPDDMEGFACPGIVLFFQPARVENPVAVFDDLVATLRSLSDRLDGVEWDEKRELLTDFGILHMRKRLQAMEPR